MSQHSSDHFGATTMTKRFEGKVVLVTGANSGIGEATAVAYQEAGATVYGVARRQETLQAARAKHPNIHWVLADVSKASDVKAAVDGLVREAGRLDVLVNNAAVFYFEPLEGQTESLMKTQFEINVYGPILVSQAALPALKASRGSIVNIGSAAGHKAAPGGSIYGATKAALESLTRSWALELAPAGVRVNAIAPGPTETPGFEKSGIPAEMIPAVKAAFVKQVPLGRMASTAEITPWILNISDPGVTWITGQIFSVDGGMSLT
jgi:NAD(P)-dependent dehydrogenase (short-subunit alcohol dehydrogenase family)